MTEDSGEMSAKRVRNFLRFAPIVGILVPIVAPIVHLVTRARYPTYHRYIHLGAAAWKAWYRGDEQEAERLATELLATADALPRDWNYGNAIHDGYQILGLVALQRGDIDGAKGLLVSAGSTPGSPQLDSYGPRMILARELLKRGERAIVLDYLEEVACIWMRDKPFLAEYPWFRERQRQKCARLQRWMKDIRAGKMPAGNNWNDDKRKGNNRPAI